MQVERPVGHQPISHVEEPPDDSIFVLLHHMDRVGQVA